MKQFRIFIASLALTCLAFFPAIALADDDDLDVTMEVFDDLKGMDDDLVVMRGPDHEDDDEEHDGEEADGDHESDEVEDHESDDEMDHEDEESDDFHGDEGKEDHFEHDDEESEDDMDLEEEDDHEEGEEKSMMTNSTLSQTSMRKTT